MKYWFVCVWPNHIGEVKTREFRGSFSEALEFFTTHFDRYSTNPEHDDDLSNYELLVLGDDGSMHYEVANDLREKYGDRMHQKWLSQKKS